MGLNQNSESQVLLDNQKDGVMFCHVMGLLFLLQIQKLELEKAHLESMMETMKKQHAEQTKFLEDSNR